MHHLRGVWMWVVVCLVQAPDLEADNSPQASPPLEVRLKREQAEQAVILRVKASMIPPVAAMQLCHALARWRKWRRQLKSLKVKPLHHQLRRNLLCRAPNGVTWATVFLLRERFYGSFIEWFWAFSWMILDSFRVLYSCGRALTNHTDFQRRYSSRGIPSASQTRAAERSPRSPSVSPSAPWNL